MTGIFSLFRDFAKIKNKTVSTSHGLPYDDSTTAVRCAVGVTEGIGDEGGTAPSIRFVCNGDDGWGKTGVSWTIMFADNIRENKNERQ